MVPVVQRTFSPQNEEVPTKPSLINSDENLESDCKDIEHFEEVHKKRTCASFRLSN